MESPISVCQYHMYIIKDAVREKDSAERRGGRDNATKMKCNGEADARGIRERERPREGDRLPDVCDAACM